MFPKLKTSAKSVQTTRVVSSNFSYSLYRLRRVLHLGTHKYKFIYVYLSL